MKVEVLNLQGEVVRTEELPDSIFSAPVRPDLMHQALTRQQANARLGTHKTKGRGEVSGGGRKPWRQKGTGRARQGSFRSPIWVGGGKVHTPMPRDYAQRMPRKMRRAALRSALSAKAGQGQLVVVDELSLTRPRTADMAQLLGRLGTGSALILLPKADRNVEKSARNLPDAKALPARYLNVQDLLGYERVILPWEAVGVIESFLAVEEKAA
jgi:large subunit ribosomal protein L4